MRVLDIKPFFLPVDMQHNQCPCWLFILKETEALLSHNYDRDIHMIILFYYLLPRCQVHVTHKETIIRCTGTEQGDQTAQSGTPCQRAGHDKHNIHPSANQIHRKWKEMEWLNFLDVWWVERTDTAELTPMTRKILSNNIWIFNTKCHYIHVHIGNT